MSLSSRLAATQLTVATRPPAVAAAATGRQRARMRECEGVCEGRRGETITSATAHAQHLHLESGQWETSSHNCAWGNVCGNVAAAHCQLQLQLHQVVGRTDFDCASCFSFFCQQFAVIKDICVQHVHPCTIVSACPHVRCVRCRFALMKLHYTKWRDEERCEKQKKSAKLHKNTQEKREREGE